MRRHLKTDHSRTAHITVALAAAVLFLLAFASPSQAKVLIDSYGVAGTQGGQFSGPSPIGGGNNIGPSGVAVNSSGAGGVTPGTVYVADTSLNRIQRFSPAGVFERAWGKNVSGRDEQQEVRIFSGDPSLQPSGTFTLAFNGSTTGNIEGPADTSPVRDALAALPSIGTGNVSVLRREGETGATLIWTIRFTGALSGTDVSQLIADGSGLNEAGGGAPSISASTIENGSGGSFTGFEICTDAPNCQGESNALAAANGGQLDEPNGIAVNQSSGHVYVTETGNRRVSEFDADGGFIRAWGWDVVSSGGTGDVSSDAFEICTVAAECKQAAAAGAEGGRFGGSNTSLAVDSSGNVWVADSDNRRIQEFGSTGSFIAAYGWDVDALGGGGELEKCTSTASGACQAATPGSAPGQFAAGFGGFPRSLAFDSSGNLYAPDPRNDRVQRFNPALTSATDFAAAALAPFSLDDFTSIAATQNGNGIAIVVGGPKGFHVAELDLAGNLIETSIPESGFSSVDLFGIAADQVTDTIYLAQNLGGNDEGRRGALVLGNAPPPVPSLAPITVFDDSSATFAGTVDPMGGLVECKFQYSTDQVEWTDVPEPGCDSLSSGGGPQALSEEATGLEPGSHYFVRLRVSRLFDASTIVDSAEQEFTALSLPPILSGLGATQIADTSAYLVGVIEPRSQITKYHFKYGPTPALGSSTPEVEILGSAKVIVSQQVTGLNPDTDYHFKLVATNVAGTTESVPLSQLHTRSDPLPPPDQRAYEQVTPTTKNHADPSRLDEVVAVAADGQAAAFAVNTSLEEPTAQINGVVPYARYLSRRTESGWKTRWTNTPFCQFDLTSSTTTGAGSAQVSLSANLDRGAIGQPELPNCPIPPLDSAAPHSFNLYFTNYDRSPASYELLAPAGAGDYAGASDDWSHVVYSSIAQQTPNAPAGAFQKLFEWNEGTLSLVSRGTGGGGGTPLTTSSGVPTDAVNGVSADGKRIFFQNPTNDGGSCVSSSCELYMRQNGVVTYDVSQSECTSACGASAPDVFRWGAPSGTKALFTSAAKLLNEDDGGGQDLYLYTHSANPPVNQNLTLLSKDLEPADGTKAEVQGVLGISDDAATVFFAASGQIISGEPTAAGPKLYRWRANGGSPIVEYLATLTGDDLENWRSSPSIRHVSPDGSYLLVRTAVALDQLADTDEDEDVYRWEEASGWTCASCQLPGVASGGDSSFPEHSGPSPELGSMMSTDGQRVFFTSFDSLVSADENNGVQDVYEWHDGVISLISTGQGTEDSKLVGPSASGADVFFFTKERLVGWDTDGTGDMYDARIGGGLPEPPAEGAPCEGESCRSAGTTAPPGAGAGTAAFEGPGNQVKTAPSSCPKGKRQVRRKGKARCVKRQPKRSTKRQHRAAKPKGRTAR